MFRKFWPKFSSELGIDLGTASTLVYVRGKGIVINEPSVVAINTKTEQILAVGNEAKSMLGKTPPHITVTRPLTNGIISDYEVTEKMLKYFIDKVNEDRFMFSISVSEVYYAIRKCAIECNSAAGDGRRHWAVVLRACLHSRTMFPLQARLNSGKMLPQTTAERTS